MLAPKGERVLSEQPLQYEGRLLESAHPHGTGIIREIGRAIVVDHPAGAKTKLDPALGQDIKGRHGFVKDDRMAIVVAHGKAEHA